MVFPSAWVVKLKIDEFSNARRAGPMASLAQAVVAAEIVETDEFALRAAGSRPVAA
jgi:hypothetical protein